MDALIPYSLALMLTTGPAAVSSLSGDSSCSSSLPVWPSRMSLLMRSSTYSALPQHLLVIVDTPHPP